MRKTKEDSRTKKYLDKTESGQASVEPVRSLTKLGYTPVPAIGVIAENEKASGNRVIPVDDTIDQSLIDFVRTDDDVKAMPIYDGDAAISRLTADRYIGALSAVHMKVVSTRLYVYTPLLTFNHAFPDYSDASIAATMQSRYNSLIYDGNYRRHHPVFVDLARRAVAAKDAVVAASNDKSIFFTMPYPEVVDRFLDYVQTSHIQVAELHTALTLLTELSQRGKDYFAVGSPRLAGYPAITELITSSTFSSIINSKWDTLNNIIQSMQFDAGYLTEAMSIYGVYGIDKGAGGKSLLVISHDNAGFNPGVPITPMPCVSLVFNDLMSSQHNAASVIAIIDQSLTQLANYIGSADVRDLLANAVAPGVLTKIGALKPAMRAYNSELAARLMNSYSTASSLCGTVGRNITRPIPARESFAIPDDSSANFKLSYLRTYMNGLTEVTNGTLVNDHPDRAIGFGYFQGFSLKRGKLTSSPEVNKVLLRGYGRTLVPTLVPNAVTALHVYSQMDFTHGGLGVKGVLTAAYPIGIAGSIPLTIHKNAGPYSLDQESAIDFNLWDVNATLDRLTPLTSVDEIVRMGTAGVYHLFNPHHETATLVVFTSYFLSEGSSNAPFLTHAYIGRDYAVARYAATPDTAVYTNSSVEPQAITDKYLSDVILERLGLPISCIHAVINKPSGETGYEGNIRVRDGADVPVDWDKNHKGTAGTYFSFMIPDIENDMSVYGINDDCDMPLISSKLGTCMPGSQVSFSYSSLAQKINFSAHKSYGK